MKTIAIDTETTGLDLRHSCKPYFVSICEEGGEQKYWHWQVNPLTRQPIIPKSDLIEIQDEINIRHRYSRKVFHNSKFDVLALQSIGFGKWDWSRTDDTLIAGHLLASNRPHNLTSMVLEYLQTNIQPYDDALQKSCNAARRTARKHFPEWKITTKLMEGLPSASQKLWKCDTWLPGQIADALEYEDDHEWRTVLEEYANVDSAVTLVLWQNLYKLMQDRGLLKIYESRKKDMQIALEIEDRGVTISQERTEEKLLEYKEEVERIEKVCKGIAQTFGYDLTLPKSGTNHSLVKFIYGEKKDSSTWLDPEFEHKNLGIKPVLWTKTGNPSLAKDAIDIYKLTLNARTKQYLFIKKISERSKRATALSYMESYQRFWIQNKGERWSRLYPNLNPTGTVTLRMSSSNPNEQNISKKEDFNLRYIFGPAPGREWYSIDAKNIELRIPAYESEEESLIQLFERPDDPPYYGSNHLLCCHILHPEKFDQCLSDGESFKDKYKSTWYQWTKNGNFAVQYGAIESSGTADRAYHLEGAQRIIQSKFTKLAKLNQAQIAFAERNGYVETMPDKTVDPRRGYPLQCTRTEHGRIKPTVPLNYHVQGTAMWWMHKAMIRCHEFLSQRYNANHQPENHAYMIMQVHDEIVFDLPSGVRKDHKPDDWEHNTNRAVIKQLKVLMERGGDDIGIPTPCDVEWHPRSWSEGINVSAYCD